MSVQPRAGNVAVLPPPGPCLLPPPLLAKFTVQWLVPSLLVQNPPRRVFFQYGNLGALLEEMISDKPTAGERGSPPSVETSQGLVFIQMGFFKIFFFNLSKNASVFTM